MENPMHLIEGQTIQWLKEKGQWKLITEEHWSTKHYVQWKLITEEHWSTKHYVQWKLITE